MSSSTVPARISGIRPPWALEGGRVEIDGTNFPIDGPRLPAVQLGSTDAHVVHASPRRIAVIVPAGLGGGPTQVRIEGVTGETPLLEVGRPIGGDLHLVDNPAFDQRGNLYVTFSGSRGSNVETSLFRIGPDGVREPLPAAITNPTSLAVDPDGRLYVSSRFEGTVYRVEPDGSAGVFASDLGVPCGLAWGPDGALYVGDRSGSIFCLTPDRQTKVVVSLPPSVAAYHLAFGPDGCLYVTAPTLSTRDAVYRVELNGRVSIVSTSFGRPQGLAFDHQGQLYVVESLAGMSGLYRLRIDSPDAAPEHVLAGAGLIGLAFDPRGGLVMASSQAAYRFEVPLRQLALPR